MSSTRNSSPEERKTPDFLGMSLAELLAWTAQDAEREHKKRDMEAEAKFQADIKTAIDASITDEERRKHYQAIADKDAKFQQHYAAQLSADEEKIRTEKAAAMFKQHAAYNQALQQRQYQAQLAEAKAAEIQKEHVRQCNTLHDTGVSLLAKLAELGEPELTIKNSVNDFDQLFTQKNAEAMQNYITQLQHRIESAQQKNEAQKLYDQGILLLNELAKLEQAEYAAKMRLKEFIKTYAEADLKAMQKTIDVTIHAIQLEKEHQLKEHLDALAYQQEREQREQLEKTTADALDQAKKISENMQTAIQKTIDERNTLFSDGLAALAKLAAHETPKEQEKRFAELETIFNSNDTNALRSAVEKLTQTNLNKEQTIRRQKTKTSTPLRFFQYEGKDKDSDLYVCTTIATPAGRIDNNLDKYTRPHPHSPKSPR